MSAVTELTQIGSLVLADANLKATVAFRDGSGPGAIGWDVSFREDGVRPSFERTRMQPRVLGIVIQPAVQMDGPTWDAATDKVLAELDGDGGSPVRIKGPHRTLVGLHAMTVGVESVELAGGSLVVTAVAAEPYWTNVYPFPNVSSHSITSGSHSFSRVVPGGATVVPLITILPVTQRGAGVGNANAGWTWRRRGTVTNNADAPLVRYPLLLDLGNTATLVSGSKALASGDDLRIWIEGRDTPRTLVRWNTAGGSGTSISGAWVVVPYLAPGETLTFDVMYGNPGAGPPPLLDYPDLPPFDLTDSHNGRWAYGVDDVSGNHLRGGWYLEGGSGNAVAFADVDVPGAWRRSRTLPRAENVDDVSQPLWSEFVAGGTTYRRAVFDATLYRSGAANLPDEGVADGVEIECPLGIVSVRAGLSWLNHLQTTGTVGVGQLLVLARQAAGDDWSVLYQDVRTGTSPYTVSPTTWTPATATRRVAFAVWPIDSVAVPEYVGYDRYARAVWDGELVVTPDAGKLAFSALGAETAVFDIAMRIDAGDYSLFVGAAPGGTGNPDPTPGGRLALAISPAETLEVNCEARTATIGGEPAPVVTVDATRTVGGRSLPTATWMPMRPGEQAMLVTSDAPGGRLVLDIAIDPGYV